jgi:hypothetical protein
MAQPAFQMDSVVVDMTSFRPRFYRLWALGYGAKVRMMDSLPRA